MTDPANPPPPAPPRKPDDDGPVEEPRRTRFTWIDVAVILILGTLTSAIMVPNFVYNRRGSTEVGAVGALKTINTSQCVFREGDKETDGNLDYGMLSELSNTNLVDSVLGSGKKQGYFFSAAYSFRTSEFLWFAVANPQVPMDSGDRYFVTNQDGVIFYTTGGNLALDTDTCAISTATTGLRQVGK